MRLLRRFILVLTILLSSFLLAQEAPYFVTYDHHLEEPRNLEIATSSTIGVPRAGQKAYFAPYLELEYAAKAWWTTEFYLEGHATLRVSAVFAGRRLAN